MRALRSTLAAATAAAGLAATLGTATPAAAQPFAPTNTLDGLGVPSIVHVGQTIVAPAATPILQAFSFYLGDAYNGANLRFDAAVYEYAGGGLLGALVGTAATGAAGSGNVFGLDFRTFTAGFTLNPTLTYVLLLSATGAADADRFGARNLVGTTEDPFTGFGDVYAGGTLVLGDDPTALAELPFDAAFDARFAAAPATVPEPATLSLLAGGVLLVGVVARRRATRA